LGTGEKTKKIGMDIREIQKRATFGKQGNFPKIGKGGQKRGRSKISPSWGKKSKYLKNRQSEFEKKKVIGKGFEKQGGYAGP